MSDVEYVQGLIGQEITVRLDDMWYSGTCVHWGDQYVRLDDCTITIAGAPQHAQTSYVLLSLSQIHEVRPRAQE